MNKVIVPGQPSFGAATKAINKTNEQREKELQQREQLLNQDAARLNIAKRQLADALEIEERRKVEQAFDFAVRTYAANSHFCSLNIDGQDQPAPIDVFICQLAKNFLAEINRLTQKGIEERKAKDENQEEENTTKNTQ